MPPPEVVCAGILVADVICRPVREAPPPGGLALVDALVMRTGGCALNSAIGLARAGVRTALAGRVGRDAFGDFLVASAEAAGVDARVARDRELGSSASVVLVSPSGERAFLHHVGANAAFRVEDVPFDAFAGAKAFHLAGAFVMDAMDGEGAAEALRRAREMGMATSLDTVWDARGRWLDLLAPALPHLDCILPSVAEAEKITGRSSPAEIARFFLDRGVRVVALKRGERGAFVTDGRETIELPAFTANVVDTTGAGDAFAAGYVAGLVRGRALRERALLGNAAGAACVSVLGAVPPYRSLTELEAGIPAAHR